MCLQEPGSFTSIIAAMVRPRKTSSETIRPARAGSAAASTFETGAAIVSAVAMRGSSACGDTTAPWKTPQCRGRLCIHPAVLKGGTTETSQLRTAIWTLQAELPRKDCALIILTGKTKAWRGGGSATLLCEGRNSCVRAVRLALLADAQVVDATEQRTGKARALRDPPHVAHPAMPAVQHLSADVVHHQGTHLNRRVERSVPREGLKHWIQFLCVSRRNGASRCPSVKSGGAVCSDSKSYPKMVFVALLDEQLANGYGHWLAGSQESIQGWAFHRGRFGSARQFHGIGSCGRMNRYGRRDRRQWHRNFAERGEASGRRIRRLNECNLLCGEVHLRMNLWLNQEYCKCEKHFVHLSALRVLERLGISAT